MRVGIVGAGPAGLYAAWLIRTRRPDARVEIVEQNPAGASFGFGVVFSDQALDFLADGDSETVSALASHLVRWSDITLVIGGRRITIDGIGFTAIGRLALLEILTRRAAMAGVVPRYETRLTDLASFDGFDLVIGADGVNSLVRRTHAAGFGETIGQFSNRFAWYGTAQPFATLTQTFRRTADGSFNAHHYRYSADMSTFIVEVDAATFERAGFATMGEDETRRRLEAVFAADLGGRPLISNRSLWRRFPRVRNERWHCGNRVLVGDALRTAHFSIGSGTRLALEDVIALVSALEGCGWNVPRALAAYDQVRRPIVEKLVAAADASASWYDGFAGHLDLPPWEFALAYVTRSGRIAPDRLRRLAPRFTAAYERATGRSLEVAA